MNAESQQAKDRERWKLAKRMQRKRQKLATRLISAEFHAAVMEERDRRALIARFARREVNGIYVDVAYRISSFVAEVWAAKVLLQTEHGVREATPTRIARSLWNQQLQHGYAKNSLRPMVYQAIRVIEELETYGGKEGEAPFWGAFHSCFDKAISPL